MTHNCSFQIVSDPPVLWLVIPPLELGDAYNCDPYKVVADISQFHSAISRNSSANKNSHEFFINMLTCFIAITTHFFPTHASQSLTYFCTENFLGPVVSLSFFSSYFFVTEVLIDSVSVGFGGILVWRALWETSEFVHLDDRPSFFLWQKWEAPLSPSLSTSNPVI